MPPQTYHFITLRPLSYMPMTALGSGSQFAKATVKQKKCINGELCAHQSSNFHWCLVFSSINPKCAFHFIFPPFENICLAFALGDWEGGREVTSKFLFNFFALK